MADSVLLIEGVPLKIVDLGDGTFAPRCVIGSDWVTEIVMNAATLDNTTADGSIGNVPAGAIVMRRILVVITPWDTAATLQVGTAADPDRYMAAGDINLQVAGPYQVNDAIHELAGVAVMVDFNHAGAAQGSAVLILEYLVP